MLRLIVVAARPRVEAMHGDDCECFPAFEILCVVSERHVERMSKNLVALACHVPNEPYNVEVTVSDAM